MKIMYNRELISVYTYYNKYRWYFMYSMKKVSNRFEFRWIFRNVGKIMKGNVII